MSAPRELLGFHGIVIDTPNLAAAARRWASFCGLPVLARSRREIVLGEGPHLFVCLRRSQDKERVAEVHLAVSGLSARDAAPDSLGGDNRAAAIGSLRLVLREFRRPPSPRWKRRGARRAQGPAPKRARRE